MKMALKHKNHKFLVMPLKHVLSVMGLVNHPGIPKPLFKKSADQTINCPFNRCSSADRVDFVESDWFLAAAV
jgi:hypothetical protein